MVGGDLATVTRTGRFKRGYSCRCWNRACRLRGHRFHRAKHPDVYIVRSHAKCPACQAHLSVDRYRSSGKEAKANTCRCTGYPFAHRRGSLFCAAGAAGAAGFQYAGQDSAAMYYEAIGR